VVTPVKDIQKKDGPIGNFFNDLWFIDGAKYSQTVLCESKAKALASGQGEMTQAEIEGKCMALEKGFGFFYQRHDPLGHVICGVYTEAPPSTGHQKKWNDKMIGGVYLPLSGSGYAKSMQAPKAGMSKI